jgi:hypothetical protein
MSTSIAVGARADMWAPVLKVAGLIDIRCMTKSGGAADSEEARIRPGGGMAEVSLGGRQMMENITLTVSLSSVTPATYRALREKVGATAVSVFEIPLDANGQQIAAEQLVSKGTLKRVGGIDSDANGSDGASFEVEVTAVSSAGGS